MSCLGPARLRRWGGRVGKAPGSATGPTRRPKAAARPGGRPRGPRRLVGSEQRPHAIEQRQCQRDTEASENVPTAQKPVLRENVGHGEFLFLGTVLASC